MTSARTAILVLGMHRSGTSMLTGLLGRLGVGLPATPMDGNVANEKGFFESVPVMELNDAMLAAGGLGWKSWDAVPAGWEDGTPGRSFRAEARACIESEFGDAPVIALKDPRICRFVPFWTAVLEDLGFRVTALHINRSPVEIAGSLFRRDGFSTDMSVLIWLRETLEAEHGSRALARSFTNYDSVLANPAGILKRIGQDLDLEWPTPLGDMPDLGDFVSGSLRHFHSGADGVAGHPATPETVRETYAILTRWAEAAEQAEDRTRLDALRAEFDIVSPMLTRLLSDRAEWAAEFKRLRHETDVLRHRQNKREEEMRALRATAAEADTIRASLKETQAELAAMLRSRNTLAARLEDRARELRQAKEARLAGQDERDALRRAVAEARDAHRVAEGQIADLRADLDRAAMARLSLIAALDRLRDAAAGREPGAASQNARIRELEEDLGRLEAERDALSVRLEWAEYELSQITSSTSWRVTGPMRRLLSLGRGTP